VPFLIATTQNQPQIDHFFDQKEPKIFATKTLLEAYTHLK
jgi:hypothetical protein